MEAMRSRLNCIVRTRKERMRKAVAERRAEIQRHVRHRMSVLNKTMTEQRRSPDSVKDMMKAKNRSKQSQKSPTESSKTCMRTEEPMVTLAEDATTKTKSRSLEGSMDSLAMTMEELQPDDWLDHLHMSKDSFNQLCHKLQPKLEHGCDTPVRARVAVALVRLATGADVKTLAARFQLSVKAAGHVLRDVCAAIVTVLKPLYVRWPGEQGLEENADQFNTLWGFPHCVGVLGSLHVPARPRTHDPTYLNSQGWSSVVMQGVVNKEGRFWDVSAGRPGSMHDADVLQQSELWTKAEKGLLSPQPSHSLMGQPLGYVLLGKPAYPLRSWLLKCHPESPDLTAEQRAFNARLNRSRSPVGSAFLRLKARWQCLNTRNNTHLSGHVPTMIQACCVLHNMCEINGDAVASGWLEETGRAPRRLQPRHAAPRGRGTADAEGVRELIGRYIHQQAPLQEPLGDDGMQTETQTQSKTLAQTEGRDEMGDCVYVVSEPGGSVSCPVS